MKTVILCGGRGLRMAQDAEIPKPMQLVGGKPLLWHIMQWYAKHGHRDFVLCLGWRGDVIREWTVQPWSEGLSITVQCVDTGLETATGGRLLRIRELLGERFMVTYGDCLADVDITALLKHHNAHNPECTITVVQPKLTWGTCQIESHGLIWEFEEKPLYDQWCNGGFMVANASFLTHLSADEQSTLENGLSRAAAWGTLHGFRHKGFWRGCDTEKDRRELEEIWAKGDAPWRT